MLDPATGWFEIAEIPAKTADVIINVLEQKWFARYPRPTTVIMDHGSEFMAETKKVLKDEYGIKRTLISTRNPQANMVERAHQTMHNLLRTMKLGQGENPQDKWDGIISAVGFAMRSTVQLTNKATPMQLVFGRDAMLNIKFQADWQYIKERKQRMIIQNNERENATHIPHTYQVGDRVKLKQPQNRKHGKPLYSGPHMVDRVNDNGTLRLRQDVARGGAVYRTWNIRNVTPYKD
jgi:NADH:ubiquinone oxidoreductase subunit